MLMLIGDGHTIVVLSDGSALAYGLCDSGQLGIGNMSGACKVCDVTIYFIKWYSNIPAGLAQISLRSHEQKRQQYVKACCG
jgi:alpha-tubulin suppressor-like RCC1 family protein